MPRSPRKLLSVMLAAAGCLPVAALPLFDLAPNSVYWLLPIIILVTHFAASVLTASLEELLDTAQRIDDGDLKARTYIRSDSQWAPLARVMFSLADRLDHVTLNLELQVGERTAALSRKAAQLRAVGQVGQQVAAVLEPDSLLHFVVRVLRGTFGYDVAAVLQRSGGHLVLAACAARGRDEVPLGRAFPLAGPQAPQAAREMQGDGGLISGATPLVRDMAVQSELAVPIRLGDRLLGLLIVQNMQPDSLDEEDHFTVSTISGQVAVALENARLLESERQLRDLAVAEERNRMAREIHDTLAQGFMGIIMQLRAMQGAGDPETARLHRDEAEKLARDGLQEARRSVWNLRPRTLEDGGLTGALAEEVKALSRRTGLSASFAVDGASDRLPPAVEAGLLRIAQEALHNTVKYAHAAQVTVHLSIAGAMAELTVADDGVGFHLGEAAAARQGEGGSGFGLRTMAERAELLGGSLSVESAPGAGCLVTVRVPIH